MLKNPLNLISCRPPAARHPASKAAIIFLSPSTAWTDALLEIGNVKVPHPEKRSTTFFDVPIISRTFLINSASPIFVACKNAPLGGTIFTEPIVWPGGFDWAITSLFHTNLKILYWMQIFANLEISVGESFFPFSTLTSKPYPETVAEIRRIDFRDEPNIAN